MVEERKIRNNMKEELQVAMTGAPEIGSKMPENNSTNEEDQANQLSGTINHYQLVGVDGDS